MNAFSVYLQLLLQKQKMQWLKSIESLIKLNLAVAMSIIVFRELMNGVASAFKPRTSQHQKNLSNEILLKR